MGKDKEEPETEVNRTGGYDVPVSSEGQDAFKRWKFACKTLEIITNVPSDWSVRVGVYGKWGEGKTSVLEMMEGMAKKEGHIVVWFHPWLADNPEELWEGLALNILRKLKEAKIDLDSELVKYLSHFSEGEKLFREVVEKITDANVVTKAFWGIGKNAIKEIFKIDSAVFQKIREHLQKNNKRVIIYIEDLDRTDPPLIPKLMLILLDFLNLPGFSYVLAFDHKIVSQALGDHHKAWGSGQEFLEKIIDFPRVIPNIEPADKIKFLKQEINYLRLDIDFDEIWNIRNLIPDNPRKIKLFTRMLHQMKGEVERHNKEELDWSLILISLLIRMESMEFFNNFIESLEEKDLYEIYNPRRQEKKENELNAWLDDIFKNLKIEAPEKRKSIKELAKKFVGNVGFEDYERVKYQVSFYENPATITWKEFNEFFRAWVGNSTVDQVNNWVTNHARERNFPIS
ncbi:MAG: hypothetical protein IIA62_06300, partial [Nitrospinae bacterium]|nr:hypothetical protein [Nitrospinota bacterium]